MFMYSTKNRYKASIIILDIRGYNIYDYYTQTQAKYQNKKIVITTCVQFIYYFVKNYLFLKKRRVSYIKISMLVCWYWYFTAIIRTTSTTNNIFELMMFWSSFSTNRRVNIATTMFAKKKKLLSNAKKYRTFNFLLHF